MAGDLPHYDPVTNLPLYSNTDLPMYGVDCEPCTDCTGEQGDITLSEAVGYLCNNPQPGDTGVYTYSGFQDFGGGQCQWIWTGPGAGNPLLYITNNGNVSVVTDDDTWSGFSDIPTCSGGTLIAGNISVFRDGGLATCEMVGTL